LAVGRYSKHVNIEQELRKPPVELYRVKLRGLKDANHAVSLEDRSAWTSYEEIGSLGVRGVTQVAMLIGSVTFPSHGLAGYRFRLVVDHSLGVIDEDLNVGKVRLPKWLLVTPGHVVSLLIESDKPFADDLHRRALALARLEVAIYGFEVSHNVLSKLGSFIERTQ